MAEGGDGAGRKGALEGEAAIVTGGASGLGLAIVERFLEEGARVAVLDRSEPGVAALARRAGEDRLVGLVGDVRSLDDNRRLADLCVERFGRLDCAVGNAGVWDYSASLDSLAPERLQPAFDEIFHINVLGALNLAKACLPALARSEGAMIFTVSNAGFDPGGGGPIYTASKHALVGLIRQLAYEWAPVVRVNGVAPGPIETDLRGPAALGQENRSISEVRLGETAVQHLPLARVPDAQDYAGAYVLLASRRDNRAATGGVVMLDAGIGVRGIGRPRGGAKLSARYGAPD